MKQKLFFLDLVICSVWMLSLFGGRGNYNFPLMLFAICEVLLRYSVSFSLYRKEKRTWIPLLLFAFFVILAATIRKISGIGDIVFHFFDITNLEYAMSFGYFMGVSLALWIFIVPYIVYAVLLFRKQTVRTELKNGDMAGGILWYGRLEKTCSALIAIMLISMLAGLSMDARMCEMVCLTAMPLTYWLVCRYFKVKPEKLWLLVIGMVIFWYAQAVAGVWRVCMLTISFALVAYVGTLLYKNVRRFALAMVFVIYAAVILPSLAIGYNQYVGIDYARRGFYYLAPFKGILYITDSMGERYGLRDRYKVLVEPEYEHISANDVCPDDWAYVCAMEKNGKVYYYDVCNNEFVKNSQIYVIKKKNIFE